MLVLSRKQGERICIGGIINITIVSIQGGRVKIGVEAPGDVRILRGELQNCPDPKAAELETAELVTH